MVQSVCAFSKNLNFCCFFSKMQLFLYGSCVFGTSVKSSNFFEPMKLQGGIYRLQLTSGENGTGLFLCAFGEICFCTVQN